MDIIKRKNIKIGTAQKSFLTEKASLEVKKDNRICQTYAFGQVFDAHDDFIIREYQQVDDNLKKDAVDNKDWSNPTNANVLKDRLNFKKDKDVIVGKKDNFLNNIIFYKRFVLATILLGVVIFGGYYIKKGINTKEQVLGVSKDAYANINAAISGAKNKDFALSSDKFNQAYSDFSKMSQSLEDLGTGVISISRFIPVASKLSSGYHVTEAGKNLAISGKKVTNVAERMNNLKKDNSQKEESLSILNLFQSVENDLKEIRGYLALADEHMKKVKINDIPQENQKDIIDLKNKLPIIIQTVDEFSSNSHIIADLLGANGPRKYLFLFQNNQEMRATGGFIGSYGVLDIDAYGRVRNFFIDGIFNPDGQMIDKVIPPKPIQKISTAWSLHDSNWFPNFPDSAKKAMLFYEKTGGPTVDGVVTLTPTVMQKLLKITGPIEMKDYGVVLTEDNFIQNIQYEVEEDYDKEENRPKKILSDLAPLILDKLFQAKDAETVANTVNILGEALNEKHILLYSSNDELQNIVSELGWSGEILKAENDYLSVINTNINGFKTDGVVDEKITQEVDILPNGEIVNTVTINRKHNGGNSAYQWWNKVNSDYMRVYVPLGSRLIEVEGQTREINENIVDYKSLNFEEDRDVKAEESRMQIDKKTGTLIYDDAGKTVFANWVYVSPQEETSIKYKYILPFKFDGDIKAYSLVIQKQSGSRGDDFKLSINYPKNWLAQWKSEGADSCASSDDNLARICFNNNLKTDRFAGSVFSED